MPKILFIVNLGLVLGVCAASTSVYTSLDRKACKLMSVDKEGGSSTQSCPGVGGYSLLVYDSDSRQSVAIVDPDGRRHDLNFWTVITRSFSTIANKAEWIVVRNGRSSTPVALIIRLDADENPDSAKPVAYWTVTKIGAGKTCVVAKPHGPNAATDARSIAALANDRDCLAALK